MLFEKYFGLYKNILGFKFYYGKIWLKMFCLCFEFFFVVIVSYNSLIFIGYWSCCCNNVMIYNINMFCFIFFLVFGCIEYWFKMFIYFWKNIFLFLYIC